MSKTIDPATFDRDQRSLLLYLETRAVDHDCRLKSAQLNDTDRAILKKWAEAGFIESGRIAHDHLDHGGCVLWARLSDEAWSAAQKLRREKADRMWEHKTWQSTKEARE